MSGTIVDEVMFLLDSFFLGAVITCVYDGFLILRRLIKHNMLFYFPGGSDFLGGLRNRRFFMYFMRKMTEY